MNLFSVNGGLLNGAGRLIVVAASAAFACSAAVSATGLRSQDALVSSVSTANLVAVPTLIQQGIANVDGGSSGLFVIASQQKTAKATFSSTGELRAFVYRSAEASAYLTGSSEILAIPASVLGQANFSLSTGAFQTVATKTQPGYSSASGLASVSIQAAPTISRFVSANLVLGSADFYAETAINKVGEAYVNIVCVGSTDTEMVGLVTRPASAQVSVGSVTEAKPTHTHPGQIATLAIGSMVLGNAFVELGGLALLAGSAELSASAFCMQMAVSTTPADVVDFVARASVYYGSSKVDIVVGTGVLRVNAERMTHGSASASTDCVVSAVGVRYAECAVGVVSTGLFQAEAIRSTIPSIVNHQAGASVQAIQDVTTRFGSANPQGSVDIAAVAVRSQFATASTESFADTGVSEAIRIVYGSAEIENTVEISAVALRDVVSSSQTIDSFAEIQVSADTTVREGSAAFASEVSLVSLPEIIQYASSDALITSATVMANGVRMSTATSIITNSAEITADSISNPYSADPVYRTFNKPKQVTDFTHIARVTEFKRPA